MGFAKRLVRKSVRKATPRSVRRAMHPVRTLQSSVTPRPLKQLNRAVYTVTNPLGAAENALIGAALYPNHGRRRSSGPAPQNRSKTASGTGVRAQESAEVHDRLASLMAVQRERFASSDRPIIAVPPQPDAGPVAEAEWRQRKREVRPWRRSAREKLHAAVREHAKKQVEQAHQYACREAEVAQTEANRWWEALKAGDCPTVTAALEAAFADNPAPVAVAQAQGNRALLVLLAWIRGAADSTV